MFRGNGLYVFRDFRDRPLAGTSPTPGTSAVTWVPHVPAVPAAPGVAAPPAVPSIEQRYLDANTNLLNIYVYHLAEKLGDPHFLDSVQEYPQILFIDIFRLIACSWVAEVENEHMQYSWMEKFWQREATSELNIILKKLQSTKLDMDVVKLHGGRIKIGSYHQLIAETKRHCDEVRGEAENSITSPSYKAAYNDLSTDFETVLKAMQRLEQRNGMVVEYLEALRANFATQRSLYHTIFGLLISIWALLYSPFSLISSILSVRNSLHQNDQHFWLYWAIATPFFIIAIIITIIGSECLKCREFRNRKEANFWNV